MTPPPPPPEGRAAAERPSPLNLRDARDRPGRDRTARFARPRSAGVRTGRRLRPPQIVAASALTLAVLTALAVALGGEDEQREPTLREQYGGHAGRPMSHTGVAGRIALDGRWRVALDPQGTGAQRAFARGRFGGQAVRLPYVPNAGRITGKAGERSFEGSVAWYRTTFRVPKTGRYALRFESVNHKADVWVDGRRVGGHTGVYLPFEVRPQVDAGRTHTLVVRADWRDPMGMKAEGWHRAWFNFGGINREVTIRPVTGPEVPQVNVRTQLAGPARGATGNVRLNVRARLRASAGTAPAEPVRITGTLRRGGRAVPLRFPAATVRPGASREVRTTVQIPGAALWSPERPALHDLEVRVAGRPAWRGRIGLREIRRDGTRILLNGRPLKLRGASLHEDVPGRGDGLRPADEAKLVQELTTLGANATRAQHPLSPSLLEKLDARGILVWLGVGPVDAPGAWTSRGPKLVDQAKERVRRSLAQLQTHPSIFAWNLANEVAGQGHPAGQAPYIDFMARELKRKDPGRLVGLDVWGSHPPKFAGPMYGAIDAIGYTNYLGWYEQPYATTEQLEQLIRTKVSELQTVFPDKAMVVTEFGAEGSPRNPQNAPGGHAFQARVLRTHIRTYGDIPGVSGMLVWNLRDFAVIPSFGGGSIREVVDKIVLVPGLNEKGLHTYGGRPKPAAAAVKQEFAKLARR
jgi:hypothetical protein